MKKIALAVTASVFGLLLTACGPAQPPSPGPSTGEGSFSVPAPTGPSKTRAEVLAELATFKAACKADPKLEGCGLGEATGTLPTAGGAGKTRAEVSAELAAFLAACRAAPKGEGCPGTTGGQ